ncbi:MAG TPA: hypothetical protein VGV14_03765, partial [Rhodanobacter sp.]|nr:hypothetical protein [Rhodanobacter sp.]
MKWILVVAATWLWADVSTAAAHNIDQQGARTICSQIVGEMTSSKKSQGAIKFSTASPDLQKRLSEMGWSDPDGQYAELKIHGKTEVFEYRETGGSCHSEDIVRVRTLKTGESVDDAVDSDLAVSQDDNDLRWATWGASSDLYKVRGEAVVVAGTAWNAAVYAYQEDARVPLCTIKAPASTMVVRSGGNDLVCKAAQRHELTKVPETKITIQKHELDDWGIRSDSEKLVMADSETNHLQLANLHFDSGAGCGSSQEYLVQVDATGHIVDSQLTRALLDVYTNGAGERFANSHTEVSVLTFGRQPVVAKKDAKHTKIFRLGKDSISPICELDDLPQSKIDR